MIVTYVDISNRSLMKAHIQLGCFLELGAYSVPQTGTYLYIE
jgi:hypothetical protein